MIDTNVMTYLKMVFLIFECKPDALEECRDSKSLDRGNGLLPSRGGEAKSLK